MPQSSTQEQHALPQYTIAILVRNEFGVLNRVTSMFRRRLFNITCLTVSETERPQYSRITVRFEGEDVTKRQLVSQLHKLPDVVSVSEFSPEDSISAELLLIKVENDPTTRRDLMDAANAFGAKVVDYTRESITFQLTGQTRDIDSFIDILRGLEIMELCRTGVVSLERGAGAMRNVTKL